MNTIFIDTRNNKQIEIKVDKEGQIFEANSEANVERAQAALPLIEKLLEKAQLKIDDINEIKVETSPGSFTGLRVGVSIANALAFGLNIKVNGKPLGEIELPQY